MPFGTMMWSRCVIITSDQLSFKLYKTDVPTMTCGPVQTVTSMGGNLLCAVMEDPCCLSSSFGVGSSALYESKSCHLF